VLSTQLSTSGFRIYPAMFEITGDVPEPIVDEIKEAWLVRRMTGLNWKSDSAATVIRRLPKGNGRFT